MKGGLKRERERERGGGGGIRWGKNRLVFDQSVCVSSIQSRKEMEDSLRPVNPFNELIRDCDRQVMEMEQWFHPSSLSSFSR